jgi:hypothetical protein
LFDSDLENEDDEDEILTNPTWNFKWLYKQLEKRKIHSRGWVRG